MKTFSFFDNDIQKEHMGGFALVSWKSIFAGLFVALFCYITLMALGTAIGGSAVSGVVQNNENASGIAVGAGVWLLISALVSLGIGSYFAARISNFVTKRVGAIQGAIIASLFFALMIYGATTTLGAMGGQVSSLISSIGGGASNLATNPQVQNIIERSFGEELNLKSDPQVVAQGLAVRLLQGNDEAAKNYLAYQTSRSRADIEQRFEQLKTQFTAAAQKVGSEVAKGVSTAGWILFGTLFLGMLFSVLGGSWGASANFRKPLAEDVGVSHAPLLNPQPV